MTKPLDLDELPRCKECGEPLGMNPQGCDTCRMDWSYAKPEAKK